MMHEKRIPAEAFRALDAIKELLGSSLVSIYLYGSAVLGGLQKDSDVDLLAVIRSPLSDDVRNHLAGRLFKLSGRIGNQNAVRPLEVTVVLQNDIIPWRYPPRKEFIYGEWLRAEYERGHIPGPVFDPDLTILLCQARAGGISLFGPEAIALIQPVNAADINRAMRDCLPDLLGSLKGDERNVLLTLARMLLTAVTGQILSKDAAARWAVPRLPGELSPLLVMAEKAYLGECVDSWEGKDSEVMALAKRLRQDIESSLNESSACLFDP